MKAKLVVEGKEFNVDINHTELEKLLKSQQKTGYERASKGCAYHFVDADSTINGYDEDEYNDVDDVYYEQANYYSDRIIAENNARADKLMRQLRRFAVEHRKSAPCWLRVFYNTKYSVIYDYPNNRVMPTRHWDAREAFVVYFDSEETANLAIETFHDELIWYFTEYKDSL